MKNILIGLLFNNRPRKSAIRWRMMNKNLKGSSLSTSKKGMTLVEILVSLTIMMVVLGAVYSILNIQKTKAVNVQETTVMQTDAQVALALFRWDIFMAGFGMANDADVIMAKNDSTTADSLGMFSMAFGFEATRANWAPVLEAAQNSQYVKVFRHDDNNSNLKVNDTIVIVSPERELLESDRIIQQRDTIVFQQGQNSVPGWRLRLDAPVSVGMGSLCVKIDANSYFNGISYYINNQHQLMRGNQVFLNDVEDLQFSYGLDENDNGTIDTSEWHNDLSGYQPEQISSHTLLIRATFVVLSEKGMSDYNFPQDTLMIEDHTYSIAGNMKKHKRVIVRSVTFPRNLRT